MQSISNKGPIVFTYTLFGLGNVYATFVSDAVIRLFEILKMFYPPTNKSPIVFTYTLFGLGKVYWSFVSGAVIRLFEILKMFYPPKGLR